MPLTASGFIQPSGFVNPGVMFPGRTVPQVQSMIQTAITEGYLKVASLDATVQDRAVSAWVRYIIWSNIYAEVIVAPASAAMADQGSQLMTSDQRAAIKTQADTALAEFNGYLDATASATPPSQMSSASVSHKIAYK